MEAALDDEFAVAPHPAPADDQFVPEPPSMRALGHNVAPSIGSFGPGMAGQGAFGGTGQPQPDYTQDDLHEQAGGAYSSEPHVMAPYNPEAYGSFAGPQDHVPQPYYEQQSHVPQAYNEQQNHVPQAYHEEPSYAQPSHPAQGPNRMTQYNDGDAYGGI